MAGGGDLGFYIGSYANDAAATLFLTSRGYTQARGYEYWDSVTSQLKKWDGSGWGVITGTGATSPWGEAAGVISPLTPATDDVVIGAAAMSAGERLRVVGGQRIEKSDSQADDALYIQASGSHPNTESVVTIDQDITTATAASLLIDSEVGASGAPLLELQALNTNNRGDIAFSAARTGDPGAPVKGDLWWQDTAAAFKYYDGISVQTISVGGTSPWTEVGAPAVLYPSSYATDDVVVGANAMSGTERFRVAGDARFDTGTVGMGGTAPASDRVLYVQDDLDDSGLTYGLYVLTPFDGVGTKTGWYGVYVDANQGSTGTITAAIGLGSVAQGGSGCTYTTWDGVRTAALLTHASDLISTYYGLHVAPTAGTNGTVTTGYGLRVEDVGQNSTTVYGVYIDDQSGTTTYGIYQAGSDDLNYLAGNTGVGAIAASDRMLYVQDDLDDSGLTYGLYVLTPFDGVGTKTGWYGVYVDSNQGSTGTITAGVGLASVAQGGSGCTYTTWDGVRTAALLTHASDLISTYYGLHVAPTAGTNGTVTTGYGLRVEDVGQNSTTVYGVYVDDQSGTTTYGIYQAGSDDLNVFMGRVAVNETALTTSSLYVEVLDDNESGATEAFRATLEKNAVGAKTKYVGFKSQGNVDDGSVTTLRHVEVYTEADGGDVGEAAGLFALVSAASGDVITTYRGVYLFDAGGAGTITTAYGIDIEDQGLSSTTTYGIYIHDQSGTTTYGIDQAGANDGNYFAGNVGVAANPTPSMVVRAEDDGTTGAVAIYHGGYSSAASITTLETFRAACVVNATHTLSNWYGLDVNTPTITGTLTNAYGVYVGDLSAAGTSYGIYQSGSGDRNYFAGNIGVGILPTSSVVVRAEDDGTSGAVAIYHGGYSSAATITTLETFRAACVVNATHTLSNWYGLDVNTPTVTGTLTNAWGVYIGDLSAAGTSYGVYQSGSNDPNYFAGVIGAKTSSPSSAYAIDAGGDINVRTGSVYRHNGTSGLTGTYSFGGGGSGDIATMTFAGGILTGITTVP